jgi:hypothetical protein
MITGMAKNERKKTASPGGTCGAEALMQIAIMVKTMTERTFRPMPRSGFIEARVGFFHATDAAGSLEAGLRLQKALAALAAVDPGRFGRIARDVSVRGLAHAAGKLALAEDRARLAAAAPGGAGL